MRGLLRFASIALAALVLAPASVYAQASVTGVVKDTSGAVLARRHRRSIEPGAHRKDAVDRHRRVRPLSDHSARSRHLHGHLHADRVQHLQARRPRVDRQLRRDDQRRHEGRHRRRDHHRHRRDAARGRAERRGPEGRHEGSRRRHSDRSPRHQPRGPPARHHPRRGRQRRRRQHQRARRRRTSAARRATRFTDLAIHGGKPAEQRQTIGGLSAATTIRFGESLSSSPSFTAMQEMSVNTSGADASLAGGGVQINYVPRDGGNTFKGLMFFSGANGAMQGTNYSTGIARRIGRLHAGREPVLPRPRRAARRAQVRSTTSIPATAVRSRRTSCGSS